MCACTLLRSAGQDGNRSLTVVCQTLKSSALKEQKPVKVHFTPLKERLESQLQAERSRFHSSFWFKVLEFARSLICFSVQSVSRSLLRCDKYLT